MDKTIESGTPRFRGGLARMIRDFGVPKSQGSLVEGPKDGPKLRDPKVPS